MVDTSRLAQRLQSLRRGTDGNSANFFKAPDDGKTKANIRLVPYPALKGQPPIIIVGWHYNVAGHRSLICPRETYGEPCPICDLAEEIRSMGGQDNYSIYKNLKTKLRFYSPVLVRGQEEDGVKLWGYGITICDALIEKFDDPDWGDIAHPSTGRDIKVWTIPTGSAGNDTDYAKPKMDVSPTQTKLLVKKDDIVKLLGNIPDYLDPENGAFKPMSYADLKGIVAKLADVEDDSESVEDSYDEFTKSTDSDDSDDSNLSDQLDDLLGDDF